MTLSLPTVQAVEAATSTPHPETVKEKIAKIRRQLQTAAKSAPDQLNGFAFTDSFADNFANVFDNSSGVSFH